MIYSNTFDGYGLKCMQFKHVNNLIASILHYLGPILHDDVIKWKYYS